MYVSWLQMRPKVLFPPLLCNKGAQSNAMITPDSATGKRQTRSPTRSPLKSPSKGQGRSSSSPQHFGSHGKASMGKDRGASGGDIDPAGLREVALSDRDSFLDWVDNTFQGVQEEEVQSYKQDKTFKCVLGRLLWSCLTRYPIWGSLQRSMRFMLGDVLIVHGCHVLSKKSLLFGQKLLAMTSFWP